VNNFLEAYRDLRIKAYFWPVAIFLSLFGMCCLILLLDPRRQFDVATVNTGEFEISHAKSQFDDWYVGGGWLGYGDEKMDSGLEQVPPKSARVSWKKNDQQFDRSVDIEGAISNVNKSARILLVEIDSDCGRVRVSWKDDYDKMTLATPYKHVFRDCTIYNDRPTPADAPPWPPNW
jgi:hypothetical protein